MRPSSKWIQITGGRYIDRADRGLTLSQVAAAYVARRVAS